jgi:glutamyl-Q tRNA(Asp) synthetase
VLRQSAHFDDYRKALDALAAQGLTYLSFESRTEIARLVAERDEHWPRDPDGAPIYPGAGRGVAEAEQQQRAAAGEPYAVRLDMTAAIARVGALAWTETGPRSEAGSVAADPAAWGDLVLARKRLPTSYHLSVVVDDARQGVTDVVRGQDLFWATSVHRLLQVLLGFPAPVYHHHRLILDDAGRKLSKSSRATALRELREGGATPADIRRMVGLA